MPNFRFISAKEILARVIRGTGYRLPSVYQDDVLEWIAEALALIQVTNSLTIASTSAPGEPGELLVKNHVAELPCGFVSVLAIEDENGLRLPEGGDVTDFREQTSARHIGLDIPNSNNTTGLGAPRVSVFEVNPFDHQTSAGVPTTQPGTSVPIFGQDLQQSLTNPRSRNYYKIRGNCIQTSFESGFIRLHYLTIPVDNQGYPLIPDNENFKQALEWHVIKRLIGAGFEHKVFTYDKADEQYEKYAARAMNEVSYPSLDSIARTNRSTVRLIPPYCYQDDFFINSEGGETLSK